MAAALPTKRFADHSDMEIQEKRAKVNSVNTLRANKKAGNALRAYLAEKGRPNGFVTMPAEALADALSHFYLDVRQADGSRYKTSSLENFRHSLNPSLNMCLKYPPNNSKIDIINDDAFDDANINFKTAMAELKQAGLGVIQHYPVIVEKDRHKLYSSLHLRTDTSCGLFNKVQLDIRLYVCRRDSDNIKTFKKDTFKVTRDSHTGKHLSKISPYKLKISFSSY
jgi:hypothetical protein